MSTVKILNEQIEVLRQGQDSLPQWAKKIERKHREFVRAIGNALQRLMELGDELNAAKAQVEHQLGAGKWLIWLSKDTGVPERTAQLAMEFSKRKVELEEKLRGSSATVADLSIREAKRILGPNNKHKKRNSLNRGVTKQARSNARGDSSEDQFEVLCKAYARADEHLRELFHQHLKEMYGLEVHSVQQEQSKKLASK